MQYYCGSEEMTMAIERCEYGCYEGRCAPDENTIYKKYYLYEGWNLFPLGKGIEYDYNEEFEDSIEAAYVYNPEDGKYYDIFRSDDVLEELVDERSYASVWVYMDNSLELDMVIDTEEMQEAVESMDFTFDQGWNFYVILPHMYKQYEDGYLNIGESNGDIFIRNDKLWAWDSNKQAWESTSYSELIESEEIAELEVMGMPYIANYLEEFSVSYTPRIAPVPPFPE